MANLTSVDFEAFVRESSERLLAVSRRILRREMDAEDALQEAFVSAWRNRDRFDGRSSMGTWMHRIVINTALNKLEQRRVLSTHVKSQSPGTEPASGVDHANALALRELVWDAIDLLPDEQRVVLLLRDVEQLDSEVIATQLRISPAAVRQRLHRARKHVAEILSPELCGAGEMTCGGRLDLLLDMIDGLLAADVRTPVLEHVATCKTCQQYATGYQRMIEIPLQTVEPPIPISTALVQRFVSAIRSENGLHEDSESY